MLPTPSVRGESGRKIAEACKFSGLRYPSSVLGQSANHSEGYVNSLGVGDISACALMGSISLTSVEADGVEAHPESYEVMNDMNGILRTVYHTARPTTSTRSEAQYLNNKTRRLVDVVATYMLLLIALTARAKFKVLRSSLRKSPIFIYYSNSLFSGGPQSVLPSSISPNSSSRSFIRC